jgi:hypothetical protein
LAASLLKDSISVFQSFLCVHGVGPERGMEHIVSEDL